MKKITSFMCVALAFVLVPQLKAQCDFTPNLLPGQSADRTDPDEVVYATVHVGEYSQCENLNRGNTIDPFTSDNTDAVITYSERGYNPSIFFIGAGEATVTYTENVARPACSTNHTVVYTVEPGIPTAYFRGLDGMAATEMTVGYTESAGGSAEGGGGGGTYVPSPLMQYKQYSNYHFANVNIPTAEITYSSTNEAVATISATGAISVKGIGTTTLSASWPGNTNWEEASATLDLTVKKNPNLYFSPSNITDSVGKVIPLHVNTPEGVTISRWTSTNANIASVDNEGNVTLKLPGSVNIYAIFDGDEEYAASQCACQVTVSKAYPHITFTPEVIRLEKNVDVFTPPVMNKPADLTETYSTTYQWSSYDPNGVASVNAQTGAITLLGGTGVATITYVFKGDVRYLAENARYYIEVTTSGITVMGTYATSANNGDIFGDGSVIYTNTIEGKALELHKDVFDANGGTFIEAQGGVLRILVKQNCEIKNTSVAFNNPSGAVFIWCQNRKDTITIEASQEAIMANALKVHDCYLFATGNNYGIHVNNEFTVSAGGYVFAEATNKTKAEAISTRFFIKGEGGIGGLQIMTRGVSFVEFNGKDDYGFFGPGSGKAPFVEIGKVPLPVADDEVTDITFDGEGKNPDENLDVVFSGSENDSFNEGEGQVEINTTTTKDQISDQLELHIACSADWLKNLPGVLVFDIPAGEGKFEIQCDVAAGFHAEAFIEGKGEAKLDAPKDGWIVCTYNVLEQTHVILYLEEDKGASPAPARVKAAKNSTPGLAIKAIKITPKDAPTGIDEISQEPKANSQKLLRNGQILILRGDKIYTVTGQEVK